MVEGKPLPPRPPVRRVADVGQQELRVRDTRPYAATAVEKAAGARHGRGSVSARASSPDRRVAATTASPDTGPATAGA